MGHGDAPNRSIRAQLPSRRAPLAHGNNRQGAGAAEWMAGLLDAGVNPLAAGVEIGTARTGRVRSPRFTGFRLAAGADGPRWARRKPGR